MLHTASNTNKTVSNRGSGDRHKSHQILKLTMESLRLKTVCAAAVTIFLFAISGCAGGEIAKSRQGDEGYGSDASSESRYNQGVAAYRAHDFDTALKHFQDVLTLDADVRLTVSARHNIGMILFEKGDLEGSKSAFSEVLRLLPTHRDALINLGLVLEKMARYREAVEHYRWALEKHTDDVAILNNLLVVLRLNKQYGQADAVGHKLLAIDPNNPRTLQNLSLVYLNSGKLALAESLCLRVLEMLDKLEMRGSDLETHADNHNNLGIIYMRMGRKKKALFQFQKALEADPNHMDTLINLGAFFHKFRNYSKAISAYRRVLAQKPDHYQAIKGLGYAYYGAGKPKEALDSLSKAIRQRPDDAHCYFLMGEIYGRFLHDDSKAIDYYRQYKTKLGSSLLPDDPVHHRLHNSTDRPK